MTRPVNTPTVSTLREYISATELFGGLDDKVIERLATEAEWIPLKSGDALFRRGDIADALYIAPRGGLEIQIATEDGANIRSTGTKVGDVLGEMQFLTGGKRTADIVAVDDTGVIKVTHGVFESFDEEKRDLLERLNVIVLRRLQFNQLATILPDLFGALSASELDAIVARAEWTHLKRGEVLFREGDPPEGFYITVSGRLAVERRGDEGEPVLVNSLGRGESIGEMALLSEQKRLATVYALRNSELFRFSTEQFNQMLEEYPKLLRQITQCVIDRFGHYGERKRPLDTSLIVVVAPAGGGADTATFAARLAHELSAIAPTLSVDGDRIDDMMASPGISQVAEEDPNDLRVSAWINAQEKDFRFVVLRTDNDLTHWTRRCFSIADRVILVGEGGGDPALGQIEREAPHDHANAAENRVILALTYPDGERHPSGTRNWLSLRDVSIVFHVRHDRNGDYQRLARYMAGRSVGLALSGGGVRGFAHIGAIRALEEAGAPIDMVGGTSMGAIIAAQYAMGWTPERMARQGEKDISGMIFDITLPITSLFAGGRFYDAIRQVVTDTQIEDLWIPFFCVSSNLSRAKVKIHRSGSLLEGLKATNAAPGIFPPVVIDGDLHVDGALLNNLPVDVMARLCRGRVVAVDVSPNVDLAENDSYGDTLSGWRILWRKLNPFVEPVAIPDIRTILQRAGELASVASQRLILRSSVDLYLRMPVEKYGLREYEKAMRITEEGYVFAKDKVGQWLDDLRRSE